MYEKDDEVLGKLITEQRNPASAEIDRVSTAEMLRIINQEDQKVALAVDAEIPRIAEAVDAITARAAKGGRLFYIGAGNKRAAGRAGCVGVSADIQCSLRTGSGHYRGWRRRAIESDRSDRG